MNTILFLAITLAAELPVLGPNFPKALFYRYANNFKVKPGHEDEAYQKWLADYGQLMGVELDSRVTLSDDGRREIIQRVKREHPEQFLIFYSTGHIKVPTEKPDPYSGKLADYSHGHWVYLPRVRVLGEVPQESGVSTIRVELPSLPQGARGKQVAPFSLRADRGDDICLYALGSDGQPDWENAEQVTLVGYDEKAGVIRVKRGCYGSTPRAIRGQVFAAVHAEVTKFHGWVYNFSTFCPKDRAGRTAGDVWAAAYAKNFPMHFDALQLDTLLDYVWPGRGVDINNNGIDDATEDFGDVNWFGVGVCQALQKFRGLLPKEKLLLPDAGNLGFHYVNGWEVEGFPGRLDPAWRHYSEVCNRLELSRRLCVEPRYTHVQHKIFSYAIGLDGTPEILSGHKLPFHLSRAVLALATIQEAAVTWYSLPPSSADGRPGVYDEICMGAERRLGWLGRPVGEPIYLARATPNLVSGNRTRAVVTTPRPELFVYVRVRGKPRAGLPVKMPRWMRVSVQGGDPADYLPAKNIAKRFAPVPGPWNIEGWFGKQPCAQTFHFNRVPAGVPLTVTLEFEGREEVVIEELGIYEAGGGVAREFERGVVLANPSPRPETFDLARLFPGKKFRRLKATLNQDTAVNNGEPVSGAVKLGEFDGLFLVRE
ncbi:MAG: hypothetical protein N3B01_07750 [Verrucomicrobiae bacterium]|nr:hypothetical protein [Verrucomicrobiae bacterium]